MSYKDKRHDKEYFGKNYKKYRKRERIVLEENKCKYIGINKSLKKFYNYKVDGDLISSNTKPERCDFLVIFTSDDKDSDNKAYFIELKGTNISKALEQIIATFKNEDIIFELKNHKYYARVISKRHPPNIRNQKDILKHKKTLTDKYNCSVEVKNSPFEENI